MTAGAGPASERGPLTAAAWLDWKLGARLLLKYPALTIIGGLSLAGAMAIGAVGIEVADELLYKPLPFDEGDRVVRLETQDTAASRVEPRVLHDFAIWRRSLKTVTELGAARVSERNVLTGEGRVEPLRVAEITASAFPLTRVPPLHGRPLQPADELQGADPVVVLGYDGGGFAMAAVGAGYHDAFGARIVAGRALRAADPGAPNRPVVVNETFMRVLGRNPVGVRIRMLQRRSDGGWGEPGLRAPACELRAT